MRKSLRLRNSAKETKEKYPTKTRPVGNGSVVDVSESDVDTGNASGLTITTDGESDTFDDDNNDLSSLSDSDKDYY